MLNKLKDLYYSSWFGGKHLELLLWLDNRKTNTNYLTYKETQQIVRQYSLLNQGVLDMKATINNIVKSKNKEEYHNFLIKKENLISLAEGNENSSKGHLSKILKNIHVNKNKEGHEQDVITATDRAKMIQKKIEFVYELQEHVKQRNMLREIRKLRQTGQKTEADKLFEKWQEIYGNSRSNIRRT